MADAIPNRIASIDAARGFAASLTGVDESSIQVVEGQQDDRPGAAAGPADLAEALAQIDLPVEKWKDLELSARGKLVHLWRPKELDN